MNPIKYIKCAYDLLRAPSLLYHTRRALVGERQDCETARELCRWATRREDEKIKECAELRGMVDKKQQEHDLTFHQLHMLRASVEAHVNRAKVQEALINEQAKHIEFLRDAYFDKRTDKPDTIKAFLA